MNLIRTAALCLGLLPGIACADDTFARITVKVVGDGGPDVILIPGLSSPRDVWQDVADELKAEARLHLVQINGFGGDAPGSNAEGGLVAGSAAEVATYAQTLDDPAIVGHSLGGVVAMLAVLDQPDTFSRLMVVDSVPYLAALFEVDPTPDSAAASARNLRQYMLATDPATFGGATAQMMTLSPDANRKVRGWIEGSDQKTSAEGMAELYTLDLRDRVAGLTLPVTLVYPQGVAPDGSYERLYADVPQASFVPIPGSRHFVMLDSPAAFMDAVRAFLDLPAR